MAFGPVPDRVSFGCTYAPGTGSFVGTEVDAKASSGCRYPPVSYNGSALNGTTQPYVISDGNAWETGVTALSFAPIGNPPSRRWTCTRTVLESYNADGTVNGGLLTLSAAAVFSIDIRGVDLASAPDIQTFTQSGTWHFPVGKTRYQILMVGGGGGGGSGSILNSSGGVAFGGNGGDGGYCRVMQGNLADSNLPSSVSVTIGAGGAGGALVTQGWGNDGGYGGATSFGSIGVGGGHCGFGGFSSTSPTANPRKQNDAPGYGSLPGSVGLWGSPNYLGTIQADVHYPVYGPGGGCGGYTDGESYDDGTSGITSDFCTYGNSYYQFGGFGSADGQGGNAFPNRDFSHGFGFGGAGGGSGNTGGGNAGLAIGYGSGGGGGGATVSGSSGAGSAGSDGLVMVVCW